MKFVRPLMEIEAMPMRDAEGTVVSYCCDFGDGRATMILSAAELETQGFRLLNGHVPGKPLKRRKKTNYRSSGEAPDLSGEESALGVFNGTIIHEKGDSVVEPAQEYDHQ